MSNQECRFGGEGKSGVMRFESGGLPEISCLEICLRDRRSGKWPTQGTLWRPGRSDRPEWPPLDSAFGDIPTLSQQLSNRCAADSFPSPVPPNCNTNNKIHGDDNRFVTMPNAAGYYLTLEALFRCGRSSSSFKTSLNCRRWSLVQHPGGGGEQRREANLD